MGSRNLFGIACGALKSLGLTAFVGAATGLITCRVGETDFRPGGSAHIAVLLINTFGRFGNNPVNAGLERLVAV